jgi:hypothetical protein
MEPAEHQPPLPLRVRWVANVALSVAAIASATLLLAVFLVTDDSGADYAHIVLTHSLTRQSLGPAIVVFGLLMVVVAATATWFITLYSSFRIAGPLFRLAQNLKSIIADAYAVPMAIRHTDMLQAEWNKFDASQARLREHYAALRLALDRCRQALQAGSGPDDESLRQPLAQLREVERRVQL